MTVGDEYALDPVPVGEERYDIGRDVEQGERCCAVFLRDTSGSMTRSRDALAQATYREIEERLREEYDDTDITYALYQDGIEDVVERDTFYRKQQDSGGDDPGAAYRDALNHLMARSYPEDDRYIIMASDRAVGGVLGLEDGVLPDDPPLDVAGSMYVQLDPDAGDLQREQRLTGDGFVTTLWVGSEAKAAEAADAFTDEVERVHRKSEAP